MSSDLSMVRSLAVAVSVGLAASTRLQIVEKKQHHLRDDWAVVGSAHGGEKHAVTIAVKQRNVDLLHDKLMEVSSPDSSKKGEYLSWDDAQALTANPNATLAQNADSEANKTDGDILFQQNRKEALSFGTRDALNLVGREEAPGPSTGLVGDQNDADRKSVV